MEKCNHNITGYKIIKINTKTNKLLSDLLNEHLKNNQNYDSCNLCKLFCKNDAETICNNVIINKKNYDKKSNC